MFYNLYNNTFKYIDNDRLKADKKTSSVKSVCKPSPNTKQPLKKSGMKYYV